MPTTYGPKPKPVDERFWSLVTKSRYGCWYWMGTTNGRYGMFRINEPRSNVYAHRFAWYLAHGKHPEKGKHVCHTCDNPLCVRPDHLFVGTDADNLRDMWSKGRGYSFFRKNPGWQKENPRPRKTHCKNGHAFTPDNLVAAKAGRQICRTCRNDYQRKRYHLG